MQDYKHTVWIRYFCAWMFFLCFLSPAYAVTEEALYQTEVSVPSYTAKEREKAFMSALQQVFVQITKNPQIVQAPPVRTALSKASTMVRTFSYTTRPNSAGSQNTFLQIHFLSKAVNTVLQEAGASYAAEKSAGEDADIALTEEKTGNATEEKAPNLVENTPTEGSTSTAMSTKEISIQPASQVVNLVVSGIVGLKDYTALMEYVRHLKGVVEVNSKQTRGDRILLLVTLQGSMADISQQIEIEGKCTKEPIAGVTASTLLSCRWVADSAPTIPTAAEPALPSLPLEEETNTPQQERVVQP